MDDKIRILIAEDDELLGDLWRRAFALRKYEVELVQDGAEAIAWLQTNPLPDVIVTDHNMPLQTGKDVLRYLRSVDPEHSVVALLITANHIVHDPEMDDLADMFLVKPVSIRDVVGLVDRLVS